MQISLVTSLYRAADFLPLYMPRLLSVSTVLHGAGIQLEVVLVANDPSPAEQAVLDMLSAKATEAGLRIIRLEVPRESVYASWNRGIEAASSPVLGFWNVDDLRYPDALIEGCKVITAQQAAIMDFPYLFSLSSTRFGRAQHTERQMPAPFTPGQIHPRTGTGPFFLFARSLYDATGPFDSDFRIAGDFEWCTRPTVQAAAMLTGQHSAGVFYTHGGNLSGGHNPRDRVEFNIVLLRRGAFDALRPADPQLMRQHWEAWGHASQPIAPEQADFLWGPGAQARYDADRAKQQREIWLGPLRRFVDQSGLRRLLTRLGLFSRTNKPPQGAQHS